jgi:hypothetical protein
MICHRESTTEGRYERRMSLPGLLAVAAVVVAAAVAVVVFVFASLAAIAAVIVAWIKREEWTLPAYRWTRDKTGRWSMTPWSSQSDAHAGSEADSGIAGGQTTP